MVLHRLKTGFCVKNSEQYGFSAQVHGGHKGFRDTTHMAGGEVHQADEVWITLHIPEPPCKDLVLNNDVFMAEQGGFGFSGGTGGIDDQSGGLGVHFSIGLFQLPRKQVFQL